MFLFSHVHQLSGTPTQKENDNREQKRLELKLEQTLLMNAKKYIDKHVGYLVQSRRHTEQRGASVKLITV